MRKVTPEDEAEIVNNMAAYFVENQQIMPMKVDFDWTMTREWVRQALNHPDLIAYIADEGMILGELSKLTIGPTRVARGGVWYVRPQSRNGLLARRLLKAFDEEAAARGAVYGRQTLDNPAHIRAAEGLYHLAGYKDYSKIYIKEY